METEKVRLSINKFLKLYFDNCNTLYDEIGFDRISKKQFRYLKKIMKIEDCTASKLAAATGLSKPTVTEIIKNFITLNLVQKRIDDNDRRVAYIELTELGHTLASTNELESKRIAKVVMEKLDRDTVTTLVRIFDELGE